MFVREVAGLSLGAGRMGARPAIRGQASGDASSSVGRGFATSGMRRLEAVAGIQQGEQTQRGLAGEVITDVDTGEMKMSDAHKNVEATAMEEEAMVVPGDGRTARQAEQLGYLYGTGAGALAGASPLQASTGTSRAPDVSLQVAQDGASRKDSRLARKQRRVAEGMWGAEAAPRRQATGAESMGGARRGVLEMIEGVEGPLLKQKLGQIRERVAKARPAEEKKADSRPAPRLPKKEAWKTQKDSLNTKFGEQTWNPRKRLSPDTLDGIRHLHSSDPVTYSTEQLSTHFSISPENIRRILKSKWRPSEEEKEARSLRWERRGERKWQDMAEQGMRPPGRWRRAGVGSVKGEGKEVRPAWKKGGREDGKQYVRWQGEVGEGQHVGVGI